MFGGWWGEEGKSKYRREWVEPFEKVRVAFSPTFGASLWFGYTNKLAFGQFFRR